MSVVVVESLLRPVAPDTPCGENLEYGEVRDLAVLAAGKPERQQGEKIVPAEEPSWDEVKHQAIELFSKTKDLRVAAALTQSLVRTDGLLGLSDGLEVVSQLLDSHWGAVHPQPESEAPSDYTIRLSALAFLDDLESLLNPIRRAHLVAAPAHGRFSLRDIQLAAGKVKPGKDENPPQAAAVEAAFRECDIAQLKALLQAVERALQHAKSIESLWAANAGTHDLTLARLTELLQEIRKELQAALASHPAAIAEDVPQSAGAAQAGAAVAPFAGAVRSREDIIRVLDSACDYLIRHEPSSPVPLLLQRAKRLMVKDFMQIIQDLAPDAVDQVAKIGGIDSQSSS
jgi:type VI secretion system protein ImpA